MQPTRRWRSFASFCSLAAVFLAFLGCGIGLQQKGWLVLWFADHRSDALTTFFMMTTWLGEGAVAAVLIVGMLVVTRSRNWLQLAICCIGAGLLAQLLKHVVVGNVARPVVYFANAGIPFSPLAGVKAMSSYSFPSGHTASAFALFGGFAMLLRPAFAWSLAVAAIVVGLSRIYLGHHFAGDVIAGALIGITCVAATFALLPPQPAVLGEPVAA